MKNLFRLTLLFTFVFLTNSCSNEDNKELPNLDKTNSIEFRNSNYFLNENGSVSKFYLNSKKYDIYSDMPLVASLENLSNTRNNSNNDQNLVIRITHSETNEYLELHNFVEFDEYYSFNVSTSIGSNVDGFKIYNKDLITNLKSLNKNNNQTQGCWWCPLVPVIVDAVVEAIQPTSMEQCQAAMPKTCTSGNPYMEFSEGLFTTTCNVGCR